MKKRHVLLSFTLALGLALAPFLSNSSTSAAASKLPSNALISNKGTVITPEKVKRFAATSKKKNAATAYRGNGKLKNAKETVVKKVQPVRFGSYDIGIRSVIGTDDRTRVTNTTTYPYSAIAHIESSIGGCTGWMIGPRTLVTAGHCVYDPDTKQWATDVTVTPGRNGTSKPYGSAKDIEIFVSAGWGQNGDIGHDYAVIILDQEIGYATGWFGYRWTSSSLTGVAENISGYPGDKTYGTQWQHADKIRKTETYRLYYANDTYGGQSGSPVYQKYEASCDGPCAIAIHTYGAGGTSYNSGTRITEEVFDTLNYLKDY
ncbi:trypsin-like serine peptidase [Thermoflavimicrobium dichotomicum]|uniref:Serine protease n=1 Tax=Thermoflavimicrobium dichotomicum TaxID=46223 RepID=A0A1I3LGW9_9BACL|nr:serine protease [Thermoflavimicrobium dichotomicum]SFI83979.1 glutamyl endopeptidase [Thermoflavimicrobium dichotomicum]